MRLARDLHDWTDQSLTEEVVVTTVDVEVIVLCGIDRHEQADESAEP